MPLSIEDKNALKALLGGIQHDYTLSNRQAHHPDCNHCKILDNVIESIKIRSEHQVKAEAHLLRWSSL